MRTRRRQRNQFAVNNGEKVVCISLTNVVNEIVRTVIGCVPMIAPNSI